VLQAGGGSSFHLGFALAVMARPAMPGMATI
jgi:hypothetical protein